MSLVSRFAFLDIVRGVAIVAVVITHTAGLVLSRSPENAMTQLLENTFGAFRYGVELFFLLSGFLIGYIYDKPGNPRNFLLMRFFRLWPLWALFTGAWLCYYTFSGSKATPEAWAEAIANLVFLGWATPNSDNSFLGGQWSIQVEVYCYIVFAFLKGKSTRAIFLATTALNIVGLVNNGLLKPAYPELAAPLSNLSVWSGFSFFALGLLLSRLFKSASFYESLEKMFERRFSKAAGLLALGSTLIAPAYAGSNLEALGFVTGALAFSLVVSRGRKVASLFGSFGQYSYSIFFSHFFVLLAMENLLPKTLSSNSLSLLTLIGAIFLVLSICMGVARASMWAIEGPALRFGKKLTTNNA